MTSSGYSDTSSDEMGELDRYQHPFTEQGPWDYLESDQDDPEGFDTPRTLIELRMCALSASIREKPAWHVKFRDDTIQAKWKQEILEHQKDVHQSLQLTENMINYIMGELEAYATLRDPETGIEPGPYERTWKSDHLIPASLKASLVSAVAPLESVPDPEKDWHPGSDGKVLDLVHPSLYPVVYGRTCRKGDRPVRPPSSENDIFTSKRFQWLPSDFAVAEDGRVSLASPYINNVHPEDHKALAEVIPRVLEKAVPMFERVLSDLAREKQLPTRIDLMGRKFPGCVWAGEQPFPKEQEEQWIDEEQNRINLEAMQAMGPDAPLPSSLHDQAMFRWCDTQSKVWPDSKFAYDGGLDNIKKTVNLRGTTLQVIVKLANIVLTPESPEYKGGKWHVEGMNNEAIVASFIYYYDCENITESTLSFRTAVNQPRYHWQDDNYCMCYLYGIDRGDRCIQDVGRIITKQDRCIAFPNLYQHLVSPFRLADASRPGHRKILVFFLVDPHVKIPSASVVPLQQASWIRRVVQGTVLWERLPVELQEMIWEQLDPMEELQAKTYREELMAERTMFVQTVDEQRFGQEFNMCEH